MCARVCVICESECVSVCEFREGRVHSQCMHKSVSDCAYDCTCVFVCVWCVSAALSFINALGAFKGSSGLELQSANHMNLSASHSSHVRPSAKKDSRARLGACHRLSSSDRAERLFIAHHSLLYSTKVETLADPQYEKTSTIKSQSALCINRCNGVTLCF